MRRSQLKLLEGGNAAMAIWLGKTPVELSGVPGEPVGLTLDAIDRILA